MDVNDASAGDRGVGPHTVIAHPCAEATASALAEARREHPERRFTAVFREPEVAALYRGESQVRAVAWAPELARTVTERFPPSPLGRVAPPPVVVGDSPLAGHITRALLEGFSEPAWPLTVHCLGRESDWARDAHEEAGLQGAVTWTEVSDRPAPVARRVGELVALWDAPVTKRATPTGPTVIVATAKADACLSIAASIAQRHPGARVAAIVEDEHVWPRVPGVTVFSVSLAREAAATTRSGAFERMRELLLADTAWMAAPDACVTRPEIPIFATVRYEPSAQAPLPLDKQPATLRRQLDAIAAARERILAAGRLEVCRGADGDDEAVILTPGELSAMAEVILETLGVGASAGARLTALELAFRLPRLARRAGSAVKRPVAYQPLLNVSQVELLAPMVHLAYQDISAQTDNATGSSLAYEMWEELSDYFKASNREVVTGSAVSHAAVGLEWRRGGEADEAGSGGAQVQPIAELIGPDLDRLAELEHRRWALFQRRNGAQDRKWMEPWAEIPEATKEYDVHIVRQVPLILADAGVEVHPMDSAANE